LTKVKINDWVAVEYTGKLEDNTVFDTNKEKEPLNFQVGKGMVIPGFDNALIDMEINEEKEVIIKSDQAYGSKTDRVVELPKTSFKNLDQLEVNKELTMNTSLGPMLLEIKEILDDKIKVVLNHPLAGKDLKFNIKLIKILNKEETEEYLSKFKSSSCGGNCSSCLECDN
jgi:peptidylprolyl isomerase